MGDSKFGSALARFSPKEYRPIGLELGVLPHVEGSARLKAGDVDLLVGVRAELETVVDPDAHCSQDAPIRLAFNVELSPNSDPRFLAKEPTDLAEQVRSALSQAYDNPEALPDLQK